LVCVNPVSVKVKYAQGELTEARQYPEKSGAGAPNYQVKIIACNISFRMQNCNKRGVS
jgi:hypothetical protein